MAILPEFSENTENSVLLYFNADSKDINALCNEIEKVYVCYNKMTVAMKDGHKYVVTEIETDAK